jgi:PTH1 family peptidyl-tRNA hydrolase
MWLVAGLGNPGDEYEHTRHNIGFMVIDAVAARYSIPIKQKSAHFTFGRGVIEDRKAVLIKPLTFMNRSGIAVREALFKFDNIENLLVVHDDLDLDTGVIRIRKTGSSGGHNGIQSVIDYLNSKDFLRLKIGIGRSARISPERYVLRAFNKQEKPVIDEAVETAVDAIGVVMSEGIAPAQSRFHKRYP